MLFLFLYERQRESFPFCFRITAPLRFFLLLMLTYSSFLFITNIFTFPFSFLFVFPFPLKSLQSTDFVNFVDAKGTTTTQKRQRTKVEREIRRKRKDCEEVPECAELPIHENNNCINQCLSPTCYESIWAKDPLEDGEVDKRRTKEFSKCIKTERKLQAKANRREKMRAT